VTLFEVTQYGIDCSSDIDRLMIPAIIETGIDDDDDDDDDDRGIMMKNCS